MISANDFKFLTIKYILLWNKHVHHDKLNKLLKKKLKTKALSKYTDSNPKSGMGV